MLAPGSSLSELELELSSELELSRERERRRRALVVCLRLRRCDFLRARCFERRGGVGTSESDESESASEPELEDELGWLESDGVSG